MAQTKKKFFDFKVFAKKIAKGQEFQIIQFYESIIISLSGGFITENSVLHLRECQITLRTITRINRVKPLMKELANVKL